MSNQIGVGSTDKRIIGKPQRMQDGREKVTGRLKYGADLQLPGLVHIRLVLSPYAHARITRIDTTAARAMPGVVAIFTATDLPPRGRRPRSRAQQMLASETVMFRGQPVVAVVAETEVQATDAVDAVEVDYDVMEAVIDPIAAMAKDAPLVWPDGLPSESEELAAHGAAVTSTTETHEEHSNVTSTNVMARGDITQGFAEADVVLERTYRTPIVYQSYLEPHVCIVEPNVIGDGLTIYTSTQTVFGSRSTVAETLGIPETNIKIVPLPVGGAFGAKFGGIQPLVAAIAQRLNRPVRLAYTRSEDILASTPAPQAIIDLKVGAKRDGRLTALQARMVFDAGCFPGAPSGIAALMLGGYYRFPHLSIETVEVLTHKPSVGAYRGPGATQATLAIEAHIDEVAHALGMDPLAFRLLNASDEGDALPNGIILPKIGLRKVLETMAEHPLWKNRTMDSSQKAVVSSQSVDGTQHSALSTQHSALGTQHSALSTQHSALGTQHSALGTQHSSNGGRQRGVGAAIGGWLGGLEPAAAACKMDRDGSLVITLGAVDISGINTTMAAIAAETFGVPIEKVRVVTGDSESAPYAGAAGGSKTIYTVGLAVQRAAEQAKLQLLDIASNKLEASPEDLEIREGAVYVRGVPDRKLSLKEVGEAFMRFGGTIEPVFGIGRSAQTERAPGFAGTLAEVEVDPATGEIQVTNMVMVQDVGFALNPTAVEGQMHGGAVQGMGWGLYERMVYDDTGQLLTASLMDYTVPRASQSSNIEAIIVHVPSPNGPFGARGVGEPPIIPPGAAVANAVRAATGIRVPDLPITPEALFRAQADS